MILSLIKHINSINELIFSPIDSAIEKLPFDDWVIDAIVDSIHLLPFLFFIFLIIEILEFYFSSKIHSSIKKAKKRSIVISSLASIFPQCGFSVMASGLYSNKIITRGCLIAVYLGTSDECLPILLAHPDKAYYVVPVVLAKIIIAISAGYFLDFIWKHLKNNDMQTIEPAEELGCCHHNVETKNKREIILHPIFHTLNIFSFILVITLILNYLLDNLALKDLILNTLHPCITCAIFALSGLIPNCAISIAVTMMLIKGHISFGIAMSALLSNSGLGLLVLLKNNDLKDTLKIILTLFLISTLSGIIIEFFLHFSK
ncbi:MAG: arsenic efflux protein [Candidatus Gastranaerophilales bacterium]|nr:arsenic efflux protein [Candidatus Gastranaerophilales bacterium]